MSSTIVVERTCTKLRAQPQLQRLMQSLDRRRGALFASNYEYPGRYRRRTLGFVDPPLVLESRGTTFELLALNPRGGLLLDALEPALADAPELAIVRDVDRLRGRLRIGTETFPEELRTQQPSPLSVVRRLLRAFACERESVLGLYGAFGYDLVFQFEALHQSKIRSGARELVLYLPDEVLVWDGASDEAELHSFEFRYGSDSTYGQARETSEQPFVSSDFSGPSCDHAPGEFARAVNDAKAAFARGDLFEVTLSQTFRRAVEAPPSALFSRLMQQNPAPFGLLMNLGCGEFLVGASPEMFVRVQEGRVETCPIAGTIARGADAIADAAQILSLLNSRKDEAELTMCTDVDRNDKARICEPGSVRVVGRRQIELYSRLIHTVDHVQGQLRAGYDAIDALLTHMWAVTVTGAPKLDAMQFIEEKEQTPRGFYGGAFGRLGFDGALETGLTLRTAHLRAGVAEVRAGATLLFDSDPDAEERETELKASALLSAFAPMEPAVRTRTPSHVAHRLRVLVVDHRDSFVHTLADYFRQADCQVTTLRHTQASAELERNAPDLVVLSPGPLRPRDFAMSTLFGRLSELGMPVFGVCLGLQGLVEFAGGELYQLSTPQHGKPAELSVIAASALFAGLPDHFQVGRYHSLAAERATLPSQLEILAESREDGCIMAVAHRSLPFYAVQFHPESILSGAGDYGLKLVQNMASIAGSLRQTQLASRPLDQAPGEVSRTASPRAPESQAS